MPNSKITSQEFNQNVSKAKRMANTGPVVITDHGQERYVLVTYSEFERLSRPRRTLMDALASPDTADIDIDFEPLNIGLRPVEYD